MALRRQGSASSLAARAKAAAALKAAPAPAVGDLQPLNQEKAQKERLSSLAKKVPEVKRGGSEADYDRDVLVRNALVHVIDLLEKHPEVTMDCWSWLDRNIHGGRAADEGTWDDSYTSWAKVPKYWLAQLLAKEYSEVLSEEQFDKFDSVDRDSVRRLFSLCVMVMPYDPIPKPCSDKQIMVKALEKRKATVGFDMAAFIKNAAKPNNKLVWAAGYPFKLVWDGEVVKEVHNMFNEVHTMERHEVVTDSFVLSYAYDPRTAVVSKGGMNIQLADLFGADSKLKQLQLDKKGQALGAVADEAAKEVEQANSALAKTCVNEEHIVLKDTALAEQRKRNAQVAREGQKETKKARMGPVNLNELATAAAHREG